MTRQALYLRYRPKKFGEVKGQQHVVKAIQTAVRNATVGHAYLLHGPRGTGKTTMARLLAKALNCTDLSDEGEPCGSCESCVSVEQNKSFDLHELDAASNNKVDDMRALLDRVGLATPGRAKVYLLDEVHMLTSGAENALLKTLEEPPEHVTWVMATTEPHKVAQTIRSRCQVFELTLLGSDEMTAHVREVAGDAGLDVDDDVIAQVVAAGAGSVRDTLSALDGVVPGVALTALDAPTDAVLAAIGAGDAAAALAAVGDAVSRGRTPRVIGETVLAGLRDAFLIRMNSAPSLLSDTQQQRAEELASQLSPPALTSALQLIGKGLVDMRQSPDPRVDLEVALVRICAPESDGGTDLVERVAQLEKQVQELRASAAGGATSAVAESAKRVDGTPEKSQVTLPPSNRTSEEVQESSGEVEEPKVEESPEAVDDEEPVGEVPVDDEEPVGEVPVDDEEPVGEVPVEEAKVKAAQVEESPEESDESLADLVPESAKHVVALAKEHLGMESDAVIATAGEVLSSSKGEHSPEDLQHLWRTLVTEGPVSAKNEKDVADVVTDDVVTGDVVVETSAEAADVVDEVGAEVVIDDDVVDGKAESSEEADVVDGNDDDNVESNGSGAAATGQVLEVSLDVGDGGGEELLELAHPPGPNEHNDHVEEMVQRHFPGTRFVTQ